MGRIPVMGGPTASPAMVGSEIGVSNTRSGPNSASSPGVILYTPPAAATSSPRTITAPSRRISSRIASLIASAKVISRPSVGVDMLTYLVRIRKSRLGAKLNTRCNLVLDSITNGVELRLRRVATLHQTLLQTRYRVAILAPFLFFLTGTIRAIAVTHPVTREAVCFEDKEARTSPRPPALNRLLLRS